MTKFSINQFFRGMIDLKINDEKICLLYDSLCEECKDKLISRRGELTEAPSSIFVGLCQSCQNALLSLKIFEIVPVKRREYHRK